jgi:outer membrane protein
MRRAFVIRGALLVALVPAVAAAQGAGQKMAYVNTQAVLGSAPGRAEAEASFEKEMTGLRAQVQKLSDSLNALQEAYAKEEVSLSPAAKETKLKTLREKQADYQERVQKLNDQASQKEAELMQPIMDLVRRSLDEVRAEGGYAFIFDVSQGQFIVAADKNLDVTDRVLAKLRLAAPKAAAPKAAAPAAKPPATAGPAAAPAGVTKRPPTA